ncbi:MAG: hypothetical protein C0397_15015 [Odoribacter sp.]|nr:hypothetical protein [Odoribacter sp.]
MKRTLLVLLLFLLFCPHLFAQTTDAATYFARYITAQKHLTVEGLPMDTDKALKLFADCAENGKMPSAMNQLGIMYQNGKGVTKNLAKAHLWFSKSAEKGDPIGMFYLGSMYKMGEGVNIDYSKAYEYFKASAEKGFHGGMYGAGYCKFKGLGTSQSYDEAVKWFQKGIEKNCPACTFMMGDCYRNGYGVEQNEEEAIKLLKRASALKVPMADKELKKKRPEVEGNSLNQKKSNGKLADETQQEDHFRKLLKHQNNLSLNGNWVGTRYFYDWSGQHIIREDTLEVNLQQTENKITGKWFENGRLVVNLNGMVIDGQIVFDGCHFTGSNRFGDPLPMQFKVAQFEAINADVNYLAGNIESYSTYTKEPGYPCYIVMTKVQHKSALLDSTATTNKIKTVEEKTIYEAQVDQTLVSSNNNSANKDVMSKQVLNYFKNKLPKMTVYPNPFKNEIKITYEINENTEVKLNIFNANGGLVFQKNLGVMPAGKYTENLQLNTSPGQYIVRLMTNTETYTQVIIKQ